MCEGHVTYTQAAIVILITLRDVGCNSGIALVRARIGVVPSLREFGFGGEERRRKQNTEERTGKGKNERKIRPSTPPPSLIVPWDRAIAWQNC